MTVESIAPAAELDLAEDAAPAADSLDAATLFRVSALTDTLRDTARQLTFAPSVNNATCVSQAVRFNKLREAFLGAVPHEQLAEIADWVPEPLEVAPMKVFPAVIFDAASVLASLIDVAAQTPAYVINHRLTKAKIAEAEKTLRRHEEPEPAAAEQEPEAPAVPMGTGQYL